MEANNSNEQFLKTTEQNFPLERKQEVVKRFQEYLKIKTVHPKVEYTDGFLFSYFSSKTPQSSQNFHFFSNNVPNLSFFFFIPSKNTLNSAKKSFLIDQAKRIGLDIKMYVLEEDDEMRQKMGFPPAGAHHGGGGRVKLFNKFSKDRPFVIAMKWGHGNETQKMKQDIILNSHIDVVPVEKEKWICDPFEAPILEEQEFNGVKREAVYARGSQDMKCIGMMYLEAIDHLKNQKKIDINSSNRNIYLTFVPDEEIGSFSFFFLNLISKTKAQNQKTGENGMDWFMHSLNSHDSHHDTGRKIYEIDLLSEEKVETLMTPDKFFVNNCGFAFDEGLATPNPTFEIFIDERKSCWFSIQTTGNVGHGSRFVENTATSKIAPVIDAVFDFRNEQEQIMKSNGKELGDVTSINLTSMKAGVTNDGGKTFSTNVIPSTAQIGMDMRLSPFSGILNEFEVEEFIKKRFFKSEQCKLVWQQKPSFCENKLIENFISEKKKLNKSDDKTIILDILEKNNSEFWFWKPIQQTFDDLKLNFKFGIFPATTDARFMRGRGIYTIGFSPMILHPIRLHDHNEYLSIEMFVAGIKIYEKIISNFLL